MAGGEPESKRYLECGRIINTHGVYGKVKLESWCDSPEVLASVGTLYLRR
ncbi:MAG: 16S rRNA processing protein RimM, partial [Clostridia bacterium]|nr:16S rRNA processing protein RimM [Clostridia bacterium]